MEKPLHLLTKKGEALRWNEDKQKAFEELKWLIMWHHPCATQPRYAIQLEKDVSRYSTGADLSQLCEDDKWYP